MEPEDLQSAFLAAIDAVDPSVAVQEAVRSGLLDDQLRNAEHPRTVHVLALGKAAVKMAWGLVEARVPIRGLGVTTVGSPPARMPGMRWLTGDHPVPRDRSFAAGATVETWAARLPEDVPLVVLLSGGASALVEATDDREACLASWHHGMRSGAATPDVNAERARHSRLKGGGLARLLRQRTDDVQAWIVADAPAHAVGSGPMDDGRTPHQVLRSPDDAVQGAARALASMGWQPYACSADRLSPVDFVQEARSLPPGGILVSASDWAPTLPPDAPAGGRCTHSAALAAKEMQGGQECWFLAGATDGVDGDATVAAAWSRPAIWDDRLAQAVERFDARSVMDPYCITTGPTGTNVGDVWMCGRPVGF